MWEGAHLKEVRRGAWSEPWGGEKGVRLFWTLRIPDLNYTKGERLLAYSELREGCKKVVPILYILNYERGMRSKCRIWTLWKGWEEGVYLNHRRLHFLNCQRGEIRGCILFWTMVREWEGGVQSEPSERGAVFFWTITEVREGDHVHVHIIIYSDYERGMRRRCPFWFLWGEWGEGMYFLNSMRGMRRRYLFWTLRIRGMRRGFNCGPWHWWERFAYSELCQNVEMVIILNSVGGDTFSKLC